MKWVILLIWACSWFWLGARAGQGLEKRKNRIRIYMTYEKMKGEWESYLMLPSSPRIDFKDFIQIRYNLFANPAHYRNKIILLGIGRNRLETLAIMKQGRDKHEAE